MEISFILFIFFFLLVGPGIVTAFIASSRGRSPIGWFFITLGLTLVLSCIGPIVGIVLVCVLPDLKLEKSRQDRITRDNRRLREQLQQERLKGEAFRQHTMGRLDTHDEALNMDTRSTHAALPMQESTPLLEDPVKFFDNLERTSGSQQDVPVPASGSGSPDPEPLPRASPQWHYESEGKTIGPISETQLVSMLRTGQINEDTLVWTEQLGDWKAVKHIRSLNKHLPA